MQQKTHFGRAGAAGRLRQLAGQHQSALETLAFAVMGWLMAGAVILGSAAPFGAAFCAAVSDRQRPAASAAALGGYLFSPAGMKLWNAVVVLMVWLIRWVIGSAPLFGKAAALPSALTFFGYGIVMVMMVLLGGADAYQMMLFFCEALLASGAAYFFYRTLQLRHRSWDSLSRQEASCLAVTAALLVLAMMGLGVFGLSLGRLAALAAVLFFAYDYGEAGGAVAGICAGIVVVLWGGAESYLFAAYSLGGMMAGLFFPASRIVAALVYLFVMTAGVFLAGSTEYSPVWEAVIVTAVFLFLPPSALPVPKTQLAARSSMEDDTLRRLLSQRIGRISASLKEISDTTRQVAQRLEQKREKGALTLMEEAVQKSCARCGLNGFCWGQGYERTNAAFEEVLTRLRAGETVQAEQIQELFPRGCRKAELVIKNLTELLAAHTGRESAGRRAAQVRSVVTDQFDGMAALLDGLRGQVRTAGRQDSQLQQKLFDYLCGQGVQPESVSCFEQDGRLVAQVEAPAQKEPRLRQPELLLDLEELCGVPLEPPVLETEESRVQAVFLEKAAYTLEFGFAQIPLAGEKVSGDTYKTVADLEGRMHIILSDGMGSGRAAAVDSTMATALLAKMLRAGVGFDAALKLLNCALVLKSPEESLATVDIASVNLYTGQADFYKAGAAPSFLLKGRKAGYIQSTSLPAGILEGIAFEHAAAALKEGDLLVLVSDGVVATGMDWVLSELEHLETDDPQAVAERIAQNASMRRQGRRGDDVTAVVAALRRAE